jgi:two-component system, NtrC family, C4-dicarboxylate transport response regulator DctD
MIPNSVRVLLIEDDPAVLLGTQQTLQLAGFEVESFADAESAITSIVPDVPAIVVCDVKLPGLDGLGLLAQARAIDRDLAVILVTGHGDIAMAVNAIRLGAYDFVEKPSHPTVWSKRRRERPKIAASFSRSERYGLSSLINSALRRQ